jgi:hypothetical protein
MFRISLLVGLCFSLMSMSEMARATTVRVATFNAFLNRNEAGELIRDLSTPDDPQARAVAEIIQRVQPDILVLQEFDYDANGEALRLFQEHYLGISQNGAGTIAYPYVFIPETNTGLPSGHDLDNDGQVSLTPGDRYYGGDCFGFGYFPGQYGMVILSRYPLALDNIRTFQTFRWRDMPGALLPIHPDTQKSWYSDAALEVFRLSSKNHVDVPVLVEDTAIHLLASHPTPPVFDGDEDRNGRRNHDEIRLWRDYITPGAGDYLYDDADQFGGLSPDAAFVILGDLNADPVDGDAYPGAIAQLLDHPRIAPFPIPSSDGGQEFGSYNYHLGPPEQDTAAASVGGLRLDYVLPSVNLEVIDAGVFWPPSNHTLRYLVGDGQPVVSSDHRLVWVDIRVPSGG